MTKGILSLVFSLCSCCLLAQEIIVTYKAIDKNLSQVFRDLERDYDLHFAYSLEEVRNRKVSIEMTEAGIQGFLQELLKSHQLSFEVVEHNFVAITHAKSIFLRMKVVDTESNEGLAFATARIAGTHQGYISDANGYFDIVVANPNETTLEISHLGYAVQKVEVGIINPIETIQIQLKRDIEELQEVVVLEYLNKGITTDDKASKVTIAIQDMEILPGLSERDILLSTQILAGINSVDESASGFNIRGTSSDNTFIYWNNIPIYQPAHYFGNISAFIPSAIGRVDIYKNHVPVNYGGASSGLLLIRSREETDVKPIAESSLNLTHADVYTHIPIGNGNGNILIAARRSFNDWLATPTFNSLSDKLFEGSITQDVQEDLNDGEFEYNSKLVFNDFNVTLNYEPPGRDKLSVSALGSRSNLDYSSEEDEGNFQSSQTHNVNSFGMNFTWLRRWNDVLSSQFSNSYSDYHMDYGLTNLRNENDDMDNDSNTRINDITNWENRLEVNYALAEHQLLSSGYQLNHVTTSLSIDERSFLEEDFTEIIGTRGFTHGLFADYFGKFSSGWQLGAGLRYNYYHDLRESRLDAQLRINYQLTPKLLLKSSIGNYHQYISALKEVDFIFSNTIEQNWITASADEDIPVINNEQIVIGALFNDSGWLVDIDGYIKQVMAPVARNFGPQPDEDDGVISGTEKIRGIDITVQKRWNNYRTWISYSFQDSNVETDTEMTNFISGLNIRHQLQLSQTLNYRQFEFSAGYTIKSGLPYTEAEDFEFVQPDDEDPFYEINYASLNAKRLPTYHRVDLSAWYKFPANAKSRLKGEFGISILNVLNVRNLYSRTFFIEELEEQEAIFRSDRQLIGITPNISLKLRF